MIKSLTLMARAAPRLLLAGCSVLPLLMITAYAQQTSGGAWLA